MQSIKIFEFICGNPLKIWHLIANHETGQGWTKTIYGRWDVQQQKNVAEVQGFAVKGVQNWPVHCEVSILEELKLTWVYTLRCGITVLHFLRIFPTNTVLFGPIQLLELRYSSYLHAFKHHILYFLPFFNAFLAFFHYNYLNKAFFSCTFILILVFSLKKNEIVTKNCLQNIACKKFLKKNKICCMLIREVRVQGIEY